MGEEMITRSFKHILDAWHGLVKELAYEPSCKIGLGVREVYTKPWLRWGVCMGFPDVTEIDIVDMANDPGVHLGMSSYTKSRWTRFLRRYFRPDLPQWIDGAIEKLTKYPNRPFVASYSININVDDEEGRTGHNYGGCLSSLQVRVCPQPTVILYSRACQLDKIGLLDLILMHLVAKRVMTNLDDIFQHHIEKVAGRWIISLPFISAISQVYYTNRFNMPMNGHALERRIRINRERTMGDVNFGPLKRLLKRNQQLKEHGEIPGSCLVKDLKLEFEAKQ